jgi:hypothetical protein
MLISSINFSLFIYHTTRPEPERAAGRWISRAGFPARLPLSLSLSRARAFSLLPLAARCCVSLDPCLNLDLVFAAGCTFRWLLSSFIIFFKFKTHGISPT